MTAKKVARKNSQGIIVIGYQGRQVKVTGLDYIDIEDLSDICSPISVESARNQKDLYDIVFGSIAQADSEFVSRHEIDADVEAQFGCLDYDNQEELVNSLGQDVNIFDIGSLEQTIDQAIEATLDQLESVRLIIQTHSNDLDDEPYYGLTTVGSVLAELSFGTETIVTISAE